MVQIDITAEEYYLSKVEECYYKLRDAMIECSLKHPEICTFERFFCKLKQYDSIVYVIGLLHRCWCFANPWYLFNTMPKDLPLDQMLDMVLCKHKSNSPRSGIGTLKEELDKDPTPLLMAYYRAYQKEEWMAMCYQSYMDQLFQITARVCDSFNINLLEGFIISDAIKTDKNPSQLKRAFEVLCKFQCCAKSESNLQTFLSIFDTTIIASEELIYWIDIGSSRGQSPSIASIYTTFSALGVDMNMHNKTIICKHIANQDGTRIRPEQLKARDTPKQNDLREAILGAINI